MAGYFSFQKMISTSVVKVVYFLGFLILSSLSITLIVWAGLRLNSASIERQLGWRYVAYGAAALVVGNILWRVICEFCIVLFNINEQLSTNSQVVTVRHVQRVPETQYVERRISAIDRAGNDRAVEKETHELEPQFTHPRSASVLGLT